MLLRILKSEDVARIVREEFGKVSGLHAYIATFNMICRKHRVSIVQASPDDYETLRNTAELEIE